MTDMNNTRHLEEDEIDLKELFQTIWNKIFFILAFTFVVSIVAVVYAYMKTPIYEAKAFVEIGTIKNNKAIENPNNLVQKLEIIYMNNLSEEQKTRISKVVVLKNTVNFIEINVQSVSNEEAVLMLNKIINDIKKEHTLEIENYIALINKNITNLKEQRKELEDDKNKFDGSMLAKYNIGSKVNELSLQLSSNNIIETQLIGDIITNDYPIKPKKKLIVLVAFVTGLILSIFIVFFMQFIQGIKKEEQ